MTTTKETNWVELLDLVSVFDTDNICCATTSTPPSMSFTQDIDESYESGERSISSELSSNIECINPFGYQAVGDVKSILKCTHKNASGELYITTRAVCFRRTNYFGWEVDRLIIPFKVTKSISSDTKQHGVVITANQSDAFYFHGFSINDNVSDISSSLYESWKKSEQEPFEVQNSSLNNFYRSITTFGTRSGIETSIESSPTEEDLDNKQLLSSKSVVVEKKIIDIQAPGNDEKSFKIFNDLLHSKKFTQKIAMDVTVDCSLDQFFSTFLADDATHSLRSHHVATGDTDVKETNWESKGEMEFTRLISYKHPLNVPIGPPFGEAEKTQTLTKIPGQCLCILTKTVICDVPMTDCFYVEDCLLVKCLPEGGIGISLMFDIHFVKSTMFKRIITMTSVSALTKFHSEYIKFIQVNLDNSPRLVDSTTITKNEQEKSSDLFTQSDDGYNVETESMLHTENKGSDMSQVMKRMFVTILVIGLLASHLHLIFQMKRSQEKISFLESYLTQTECTLIQNV